MSEYEVYFDTRMKSGIFMINITNETIFHSENRTKEFKPTLPDFQFLQKLWMPNELIMKFYE